MPADFGYIILILAFVSSIYATFSSLYGGYTKNSAMVFPGSVQWLLPFYLLPSLLSGLN